MIAQLASLRALHAPVDNLTVFDDVSAQFGPALFSTGTPTVQNFTGSGIPPTINPAWASDTSQSLVTGGRLEVGSSFEITFIVTIDPDAATSAAKQTFRAQESIQMARQ